MLMISQKKNLPLRETKGGDSFIFLHTVKAYHRLNTPLIKKEKRVKSFFLITDMKLNKV